MKPLNVINKLLRRKPNPLEQRFAQVYDHALWGDDETRSGWGSKRDSGHVKATLEYLRKIVPEYDVRSLSDIPCGDFNWQPLMLAEFKDLDYAAYDIVPQMIEDNKLKNPDVKFAVLDITRDIPRAADLILCKDLLNHLTYDDIRKAISNMKLSGSKYLLASNDFNWEKNEEIVNSGNNHRPVDICKAPLAFPEPIWRTHYMGLWPLEKL